MHMQCRGCAFVWCPVIADVLVQCVHGKFDDDVGAVCCCTVVCVQGVQEWAEDAVLQVSSSPSFF